MTQEKTVKLIEAFGSYQGEGPDSGQMMLILRCKTCNKKCSWCDTLVKMNISIESEYKIQDIQQKIDKTRSGILVTGGECTVNRHFDDTLTLLNDLNYPIANVESNGYKLFELAEKIKPEKNVKLIYSPKIFSVQDLESEQNRTIKLLKLPNVYIKIVYSQTIIIETDLIENYMQFLNESIKGIQNEYRRVWVMPEGTNRPDLIRNSEKVFDICEKYNFNFTSRNHIIFGFI